MIRRDSISVNFLDCNSIFEFSSGLTVSDFPNTNHGQFTVRAEGLQEKLEVSLMDLGGKVIFQNEMTSPGKINIEIGNHPKGQYVLRSAAGAGIRVERIVVY